ncbi:TlpA family protein disulfide reductase [Sphingobacterium anhuiense]|uniref:TlpA family protein disulfide reductase n=1 Tax=Sphingobacterium anhuiense TaxID=493780 RepID=A0ABW5YW03_9SPHI
MEHLKLIALQICLLITFSTAHTQPNQKVDLSKSLKVGDTFTPPSSVQLMRGEVKKIDWKALENKVVILDFFDTFCGTCIQSMPELQELQHKLKDKLQIFNVAWQDKATLDKFYATNAFLKENNVNLSVIFADTYLKERFPHQSAPHVIFLFKGKVHAVTGNRLVTEENILKLYNTGTVSLPLKDDFGKGDLAGQIDNASQKTREGVWITGYQDGVPGESMRIKKDSISGLIKTSFYNESISNAIKFTWAKIKPGNYITRAERRVFNVKNPEKYYDFGNEGDVWYVKNAICYERLDKMQRADSVQARVVLNDLHNFFGITSYKTMKEIECLILKPCPVKPYEGKAIEGAMDYMGTLILATMTDMGEQFPPVLDLVKSKEKITIGPYTNLEEFNEQLAAYGIEAVIGRGMQEVLVIEEVN